MFNDNVIRTPINGTAAMVAGQKGCVDEPTPQQEKDSILGYLKVAEAEAQTLPKSSSRRKELGAERARLCLVLSNINKKLKVFGFGADNRIDELDYVTHSMKKHLTKMQYKRIMSDAFSQSQKDQEGFINEDN
jgi:hypothetical protein